MKNQYKINIYNPSSSGNGFEIPCEADTVEDAICGFFEKADDPELEVHDCELLVYHVMMNYFKAGRYKSIGSDIFFEVDKCDLNIWEIRNLMMDIKPEVKLTHYGFIVHKNKAVNFLETWDCYAESRQEAIERFIKVLKDPNMCEDEYKENLNRAIIKKLVKQYYEIVDHYIIIKFTDNELNRI